MIVPLPLFVRERLRRITPLPLRARHLRRFLPRHPPVLGLVPPGGPTGRRALLTYKTASFRLAADDPERKNFSHHGLGPAMVSALHALGYEVDVIDYQHPDPVLARAYDLFVGHMNMNFMRVAAQLPASVPRVYFATTMPWRLNNQSEQARLRALARRRGVTLPDERMIFFNEDSAYAAARGIVCTGNEVSRAAYAPHPRVHPVRNAACAEHRAIPEGKDFDSARRHFLFYSGPGSVHKGLDLLLEVFPSLAAADLHLHVCQYLDPRFIAVYERELKHTPNIHVHGNVPPRSAGFYAIVDRCAFQVSPSCAEGGQGAVVEGLHQGLIPILSRECTVDAAPAGIGLPDCRLETLASAITSAATLPVDEVARRARIAQADARDRYSETAFVTAFRDAIASILGAG